jgi:hypothetical protein
LFLKKEVSLRGGGRKYVINLLQGVDISEDALIRNYFIGGMNWWL